MASADLSAKAASTLGLPQNFKAYSPFPFAGMNAEASAIAIDDKEFLYIENFFRLGDGYMRTAWDVGAPLYQTTGAPIVSFFFYTIGTTYYCAVFLSDGSGWQVDAILGTVTQIGPAGTFYVAGGSLPACAQWGVLYLLISNRNTENDYWAWDGSILYQAGGAAPNGVQILSAGNNYSSLPTVTAYGGFGTGLVVTPVINAGGVVELTITNPGTGYQSGDVVQLAFTGGGSDTSAQLVAYLAANGVAAVNVTAGGSGYSTATVAFSGGGGTGAAGTVVITGGAITGVTMTSPGSGYTSAPSVVFSGDGSSATGQAVLSPGGVAGVNVINGGSGFTAAPNLTFVGGGGSGATGIAVLTPTSVAAVNLTAGGSGYTSAPTVSFTGVTTGSGAAATAYISGGAVTAIVVTSAGSGYVGNLEVTLSGGGGTGAGGVVVFAATSIASVQMSSTGKYYTNAPAVEVSTGANNVAYATVSLMPYGVSGDSLETFQQRAWIANPANPQFSTQPPGGNWQVSAPGGFIDFATSDGGYGFTNVDGFLQTRYTGIRQSNGYLYFFADGSVSTVSNVQTSGTPSVTSFNYQSADTQTGMSWRDTRQDFGRAIIFANETGIYGLYGGSVKKLSNKLDQVFTKALFPPNPLAVTPSGATATIFNVKHYMSLMTIIDPDTGSPKNVMLTWNEKEWVLTSQSVGLTYIGTQKVESKLNAWGTDGNAIYPMFNQPSTNLIKRLDTKLYGTDTIFVEKELFRLWVQLQDMTALQSGVDINVQFAASNMTTTLPTTPPVESGVYAPLTSLLNVEAPSPAWTVFGSGLNGVPFMAGGMRFSSTSPDFAVGNMVIGYLPMVAYG